MEGNRKTQKSQKLSGDRAARKREQDRQAQRSAREKTKKLIAHLESRIETLTRFHNSGNVQELIDELEVQRKANEALRTTLRSIEKAIGTGLTEASTVLRSYNPGKKEAEDETLALEKANGKHQSSNRDSLEFSQQMSLSSSDHHCQTQSQGTSPAFETSTIIEKCMSDSPFMNFHDGISLPSKHSDEVHVPFSAPVQQPFPMDMHVPMQGLLHSTEQPPACNCCKQLLYMNDMIGRFSLTCTRIMSNQRIRDMDIPIRAVLHGWDTVCHLYPLDPIWTMLRGADEAFWRDCGAIERLLIMSCCVRSISLIHQNPIWPTSQNS